MTVQILEGDCREMLQTLPPDSIDSCITDPPYHLTSIVKRFGDSNAAPAKIGKTGAYARASKGFMGKTWDGGDIAFQPETWVAIARVLKPGAHLAAFGGTRTFHRMMVAIEDAGLELRDTLMWAYGTGFPKSHNLGDEWSGWGTALKPAWEPIALFRKPLSESTVAANVLRWRTGALNIDACRIPGTKPDTTRGASSKASSMVGTLGGQGRIIDDGAGRWPANVVHDGSDEVLKAFPSAVGQQGCALTDGTNKTNLIYGKFAGNKTRFPEPRGDSDSAARFFYCAKASKADRNGSKHPTVKPIALMAWLARLITPPNGTVLDPFAGSGTTGVAAVTEGFNAVLCEREAEYIADIKRRFGVADRMPWEPSAFPWAAL